MTRRFALIAMVAALGTAAGSATACGLEDPSSIALLRGSLNMAYPESLHVGTAIWQAQLAGRLPRDAMAPRGDLTPEQRKKLRLDRAKSLVRQLAAKLPSSASHPSLAVVLLGPVMWSRFEVADGRARVLLHAPGPQADDVVVVTDLAVVEAIASGKLGFDDALALGVMRLYGRAEDVAATRIRLADRAGS